MFICCISHFPSIDILYITIHRLLSHEISHENRLNIGLAIHPATPKVMLVNCHLYSVLQCSLFVAASTSAWTSSSFSSPSPSLLKESPAMEDTAVSANVLHHRSPSYPRAPMGLWLHPLLMANPMTYCPLLKGPKHMKHSLVSGNVFFSPRTRQPRSTITLRFFQY